MPPQRSEIQIKRLTDRPHGDAAQELLVDLLRILVRTNYTPEALFNNRFAHTGYNFGFRLRPFDAGAGRGLDGGRSVTLWKNFGQSG